MVVMRDNDVRLLLISIGKLYDIGDYRNSTRLSHNEEVFVGRYRWSSYSLGISSACGT